MSLSRAARDTRPSQVKQHVCNLDCIHLGSQCLADGSSIVLNGFCFNCENKQRFTNLIEDVIAKVSINRL